MKQFSPLTDPTPQEALANTMRWLEYMLTLPESEHAGIKNRFIGTLAAYVPQEVWNAAMGLVQKEMIDFLAEVKQ